MALKKISRSYGSAYAFATAVLRTQDGTSRAKVYANSTYALPSADGSCQLDASGTLTVYAEDTSLYQVSLYARSGMVLRTDFNVEAGSGENGVTSTDFARFSSYGNAFPVGGTAWSPGQ